MSNRILRKHARTIFQAALSAADPAGAVERYLKRRDFSRFQNIYVVGAGKAGASMAQAAERVLGRRIAAGSGVSVTELNTMLNKFFQMQTMMKKMGKMSKMMARMGGGLPGMLRR